MRRFAFVPLPPLQFLNRPHDPLPHGTAGHVAALQQRVRPLGSLQGGARAVLADQDAGAARSAARYWLIGSRSDGPSAAIPTSRARLASSVRWASVV